MGSLRSNHSEIARLAAVSDSKSTPPSLCHDDAECPALEFDVVEREAKGRKHCAERGLEFHGHHAPLCVARRRTIRKRGPEARA